MLNKKKKSIVLLQGVFDKSIFDLLKERKIKDVFIMEGRPSLEAARTAAAELTKRGIEPTLIADNMGGFLFYKNLVKEVWLSYNSADKNGAVCSIGSLILAVLGKKHKVPVRLFPGRNKEKLIEKEDKLFSFNGVRVAPKNIKGYVPLAEWVPQKYISRINPAIVNTL